MLYVEMKSGKSVNWHVGGGRLADKVDLESATMVQADGDELAAIYVQFRNLPWCSSTNRVVRWFGDHAKFIAANIN